MEFEFEKYHGTGNDFILINDDSKKFPITDFNKIKFLCDRKFGIGSDGLIVLRKHEKFDFEMFYFNSDGVEGSLCGNGSRCAIAYGINNGFLNDNVVFKAIDGVHYAKAESNNIFSMSFKDLKSIERNRNSSFLNTGSPHHVELVQNLDNINVKERGSLIRHGTKYKKEGVNVNFIEIMGPNKIKLRTYERGVEDETLSCGTGAVASSIAAHFLKLIKVDKIKVETLGGALEVKFKFDSDLYKEICLKGPAKKVFSGKIKW